MKNEFYCHYLRPVVPPLRWDHRMMYVHLDGEDFRFKFKGYLYETYYVEKGFVLHSNPVAPHLLRPDAWRAMDRPNSVVYLAGNISVLAHMHKWEPFGPRSHQQKWFRLYFRLWLPPEPRKKPRWPKKLNT